MKYIDGGVCAAKGFRASGVHCGIRSKNKDKKDLAIIVSDVDCRAAAVYTTNKVQGAPITVTREHLKNGIARAIICNSGNANTCAVDGVKIAEQICTLAGKSLNIDAEDMIICSTGVIGENMTMDPFIRGIEPLTAQLDENGSQMAAEAIMTTDTVEKQAAVAFQLNGKMCHIGAIAKGSGMINPNMATMLAFITTDVDISSELLQKALAEDTQDTFNQLSVDGDTSTNDTVAMMANGLANNEPVLEEEQSAYQLFCKALRLVTVSLVRQLAQDGEGATTLIECVVSGAQSNKTARVVSKSVVGSDLLKAAIFGKDANWGRILCAVGYAPTEFDATSIDVELESEKGRILVCTDSMYAAFDDAEAAMVLNSDEVKIKINLKQGKFSATAWGCDLTYDYVKINGDYRS